MTGFAQFPAICSVIVFVLLPLDGAVTSILLLVIYCFSMYLAKTLFKCVCEDFNTIVYTLL